MNTFERTLIEKAGADNGWECMVESTDSFVRLASSRHSLTVDIQLDSQSAMNYTLQFSQPVDLVELKRGMPNSFFQNDIITAFNEETLALILRRYAELVIALPENPLKEYEAEIFSKLTENPELRGTEAERLVRQRIGQNVYRKALMQYWTQQCAVTCITVPELLRASHAKPWAACQTDADRLNVYNGFLLSANLDALFDTGLISFSDSGLILVSNKLDSSQRIELSIDEDTSLRWIDTQHLPFLEWHRKHVFRR